MSVQLRKNSNRDVGAPATVGAGYARLRGAFDGGAGEETQGDPFGAISSPVSVGLKAGASGSGVNESHPINKKDPPSPQGDHSNRSGRKKRFSFIPHMLTGFNLLSGFISMGMTLYGRLGAAVFMIGVAGVFDLLDGWVARKMGVASPRGIEDDSLADVVSFGAAPALIVFLVLSVSLGGGPVGRILAMAPALSFLWAGWHRLGRFNTAANQEQKATGTHKKSDFFTGMPIPLGAATVLAALSSLALLPAAYGIPFFAGVAILAAVAMASTVPYAAFTKNGLRSLRRPMGIGALISIGLYFLGMPSWISVLMVGFYFSTGLINLLRRRTNG